MTQLTRRQSLVAMATAALSLAAGVGRTAIARSGATELHPDVAAFLRAVQAGDAAAVKRLLADQPGLATARDAAGRSAFVLAHLAGQVEIAELLRAQGIALDIVEAVLAEDWDRMEELVKATPALAGTLHPIGGTPLYAGGLVGSLDLWRLRSIGCDPDAAPVGGTGFTPARGAMDARTETLASIGAADLLANGSDVNAPQRGGDSVLHGAVRRRSELLVRLAIRKGARVDAQDDAGRTAAALARELGWTDGVALLADHASLPRDHRASRFAFAADRTRIVRPDLSDVPQETQSSITGNSHMRLERVRELVGAEHRLVFSISTDDELAIEASAHLGNAPIMRFHLDRGSPCSLPTAVSLGDLEFMRFLLDGDPRLIHERGAHDFPVLFFAAFGGSVAAAELLMDRGAAVDQETRGATTLHWCVLRDRRDLAARLIERGADVDARAYTWSRDGHTPLALARERGRDEVAVLLKRAGARG